MLMLCASGFVSMTRSEEHTSELQSLTNLVCRLLLEKNFILRYKEPVLLFFTEQLVFFCIQFISQKPFLFHFFKSTVLFFTHSVIKLFFFFLKTGPPPDFTLFPFPAPLRT